MTHTRRAVIYARKSSKADRSEEQSASVEAQLEAAEDYCKRLGWPVVSAFSDDGRSGLLDRSKRPGLDEALKMVEEGDADALVMLWKSRLSRDEVDRAVMVRNLEERGVEWHAVADGGLVDRSTYAGYIKDSADAMVDNGLSIRVRENWKRSHARRLEAGMPKTGNARFGYRRELRYDRRSERHYPSGPFEVDPETGPVVQELYRRYTDGTGFTPLVSWLNSKGVTTTTGAAWTVRSLSRMLDSGFAAGLISREPEHRHRRGTHKHLISEEEWQAYLRARSRAKAKPRKAQAPRWYLAGIVRCGLCSGSVYINSFESAKSSIECTNHRANLERCSGRMRAPRRWLETQVTVWFGDHFEELAAQLPDREAATQRAQEALDAAQAELDETNAALTRLAATFARGRMDEAAYAGAEAELVAERRERERSLVAARDRLAELGPVALDALDKIASFEGTPGEFGSKLAKVLRRVEVHPDRLTFIPVVGDAETIGRPNLRALAAREREERKRTNSKSPQAKLELDKMD